jgi:chaperonin cofactor prefoldin
VLESAEEGARKRVHELNEQLERAQKRIEDLNREVITSYYKGKEDAPR